ncbi:phage protease [Pseudotabrizicola algicola]|uniref:Uncharacterized protein n=1 Tax=Pseudotabrizicola algicola TaxID=2709381 RepID=A0A6B3RX21_9RHOB|nr:phage protease [Pseudotabrizicola algicola]NEX47609.1 hypothetical protein [Pseudotabrizicola algicola]
MTQLARNICAQLAPLPSAPADRIELIPVGPFKTADSRPVFSLDHPEDVIRNSLSVAAGGVLPIDFDHRSFGEKGSTDSRAAGWITGLEADGGRIMASVEWTAEGRKALEDRSYRFISPVFKNRADGQVVLIEGAGLVNTPALPQLRQLASKETLMDPIQQIAGILGIAAEKPDDIVSRVKALATAETQLASIAKAANVTGDDAVTQICSRLTATAPDPALFVPKASFDELQTQFASLAKDIKDGKVEDALEKARDEGKLTPDLEPWATQLAAKDLAEFEAWVKVAPVRVDLGRRQLAGKQPPKATGDTLDPLERQVAARMGVSAEDFIKNRNAGQEG